MFLKFFIGKIVTIDFCNPSMSQLELRRKINKTSFKDFECYHPNFTVNAICFLHMLIVRSKDEMNYDYKAFCWQGGIIFFSETHCFFCIKYHQHLMYIENLVTRVHLQCLCSLIATFTEILKLLEKNSSKNPFYSIRFLKSQTSWTTVIVGRCVFMGFTLSFSSSTFVNSGKTGIPCESSSTSFDIASGSIKPLKWIMLCKILLWFCFLISESLKHCISCFLNASCYTISCQSLL